MQSLSGHIAELLFRYDKVVIPGLGAFVGKKLPASIHPVTHQMKPAGKELLFDPNQQDDDGLLISYLVKNLPAKKEAARRIISDQVEAFRASMQNGPIEMEGIGTFRLLANGELKFEQEEHRNFLPASFGLQDITASPIQRQAVPSQEAESVEAPSLPAAPVPAERKERKKSKVKRDWISLALFFIPMIALSAMGYFYFEDVSMTVKMFMAARDQQSIPTEPIAMPTTPAVDNSMTAADTDIDTPLSVADSAEADTALRYFIVAGCFMSERNANNLITDLRKKGYDASIQGRTPQGLLRVCYQGYPDTLQANETLHRILESENRTAWLLDILNE